MIRRTFADENGGEVLVTVDTETGTVTVATRSWQFDPWSSPLEQVSNEDDEEGSRRRYWTAE